MKILDFPEFKQIYNYDCGATALLSVLTYFGIEIFEDEIIKIAGTAKHIGTPVPGMLKVLKEKRLRAELKELTIDDLIKSIDENKPVILRIQAWSLKKEDETEWKKDWKHGHYVVAIGYDDEKIYFEDPWCSERTYLKFDELKDRWHDIDIDGKKYVNCGIVIESQRKTGELDKPIHME